mgnify:CR=1 FL=1
MNKKHPDAAAAASFSCDQTAPVPAVQAGQALSSAAVLKGQKSVAIEHLGTIYRLQVTKLGKLILTK